MTVSTLDVDRSISTLRLNSQEFSNLTNEELSAMFLTSIENIKTIAYFWATIGADNKVLKALRPRGRNGLEVPLHQQLHFNIILTI